MNKAQREFTQRSVGLLLIALILLLGLAGTSPDLHRALHQGIGCASECESHPTGTPEESAHICGVTLLQTGALFQVELPVLDALGSVQELLIHFDEKPFTVVHIRLPQGRAPPIAGIV